MDEVIEWLNSNQMGEFTEVFEREKINSLLRVRRLNEEMIKEFIPQVGPRADFLACWAELKLIQEETNQTVAGSGELLETKASPIITVDVSCDNQEELSADTQPIFIDDDGSMISVVRVETVEDNIDQASGIGKGKHPCSNSDRLQSKHLSASKGLENLISLDVEELLDNDPASEAAVLNYRKNGCFNEPGRQAIVLVLVQELMKSNQSPSHAEYQLITEKLCTLFPDEDPEIYYCPPVGTRKNATGKIPNKVRNVKYALTKQNAAPISKSNESNLAVQSTSAGRRNDKLVKPDKLSGSTDKNDRTIQSAISVLKHHSTDSWPELAKSWSATHAFRFKYLRSTRLQQSDQSALQKPETDENDQDTLVNEYFKEWSILVAPNGYLLICQDFSELYPDRENGLLAKWDSCKNLIIDLASKELSKSDTETQILLDSSTKIPEGVFASKVHNSLNFTKYTRMTRTPSPCRI